EGEDEEDRGARHGAGRRTLRPREVPRPDDQQSGGDQQEERQELGHGRDDVQNDSLTDAADVDACEEEEDGDEKEGARTRAVKARRERADGVGENRRDRDRKSVV